MTAQDTINRKVIAGFVGLAMAVTFAFAGVASVNAQDSSTIAALQAQIAALQAQLAALAGGGTGASAGAGCSVTFTQSLSQGSTGSEVMALQKFLNANGYQVASAGSPGSAGMETSYFGPATRAAVVAFQNGNAAQVLAPVGLSNGTGFWGPSSRGHANAMCAAQATPPTSGGDDDSSSGGSSALQGGAGSLDDADWISNLNNEEVGEGANDVEVAGLEIEADDSSDLEIVAVRLNFSDNGTANNSTDFNDYAENVSVWFDGEKVAELDADEFEDDDNYTKTLTLDSGAIIRAGDEGDLVIAVSGLSNLDSYDVGEDWTVEFENVRYRDAQGAIITDSDIGGINDGSGRTFSFETFATAASSKLSVKLDGNTPDAQVVDVDDTTETDDVEVLRFTLKAEGDSDLRVRDLPITFATGSSNTGDVDDVIYSAMLTIDGNEFSESITSAIDSGTKGILTFDDLDYTISAGDTVDVVVTVDVNDTEAGAFVDGDTLTTSFSAANRAAADVEDENGDDLGDRTGTASGNELAFYDEGIQLALVDTSTSINSNDGAGNDTATFQIVYSVTPFDSSAFVPSSVTTATTTSGITAPVAGTNNVYYRVDVGGTATTTGLSGVINAPSTSNANVTAATNGIEIGENHTAQFTLSVTRTNSTSSNAGQYRMTFEGLTWDTTDQAHTNFYNYNLDDYRTNYVFIN